MPEMVTLWQGHKKEIIITPTHKGKVMSFRWFMKVLHEINTKQLAQNGRLHNPGQANYVPQSGPIKATRPIIHPCDSFASSKTDMPVWATWFGQPNPPLYSTIVCFVSRFFPFLEGGGGREILLQKDKKDECNWDIWARPVAGARLALLKCNR